MGPPRAAMQPAADEAIGTVDKDDDKRKEAGGVSRFTFGECLAYLRKLGYGTVLDQAEVLPDSKPSSKMDWTSSAPTSKDPASQSPSTRIKPR